MFVTPITIITPKSTATVRPMSGMLAI